MHPGKKKPRSLSGIKSTGAAHLGNLFGMILPALELQENYDCFYFIADYHALTTVHEGEKIQQSALELTATFLALGLNPENCAWYRQSAVPEITELTWILSCFTPMGLLERGHAYKDSKSRNKEVNHGLFAYPVLMAADILIFDSNVVPVGKDQKQHVEMARDIAQKINLAYGEDTLTVPEALIKEEVQTIIGLDGQKMSKSYNNTIEIFESSKKLRKKIMKITTDSIPVESPKNPETCNVFKLYRLIASAGQQEELATRYREGGMGYGEAKQALYELLDGFLEEPRERFHDWMERKEDIEEILHDGAQKARKIAGEVVLRIRERAGLEAKIKNLRHRQ